MSWCCQRASRHGSWNGSFDLIVYEYCETLPKEQRFEAIEFLRKKSKRFFSKSDYGLKHETQSHSQEDFDTRFPLRLGRMGMRRNPIPAVELVDITRADINNESLIYREPMSIN